MKALKIMITLGLLITSGEALASIYKSIDANGNVVYSDAPSKSAQLVNLPPLTIVPSLNSETIDRTLTNSAQGKKLQTGQYQLDFMSPAANQSYRKPDPIIVNVSGASDLSGGVNVSILLDGVVVAQGTAASIPTDNLDRGEHNLAVRAMNANGQIISQNSIKIYVQQGSVNSPTQKKN